MVARNEESEMKMVIKCQSMKVNIKPLSVNRTWQGKRYRTPEYKQYIHDVMYQLETVDIPRGPLELHIQVGLSNKQADLDNTAKPFIDILQKKYGFNDSRIYSLVMLKRIVPKGSEYISFFIHEAPEK